MSGEEDYRPDDLHRAVAVEELILDCADELRERKRLRDTYADRELARLRDKLAKAENRLAALRKRLKTERGQRAAYRRSPRSAECGRDRPRRTADAERGRADAATAAVRQQLDAARESPPRNTGRGAAPSAPGSATRDQGAPAFAASSTRRVDSAVVARFQGIRRRLRIR